MAEVKGYVTARILMPLSSAIPYIIDLIERGSKFCSMSVAPWYLSFEAVSTRSKLLAQMKGQEIRIPDLRAIFAEWPGINEKKKNPNLCDLTRLVDKRLER